MAEVYKVTKADGSVVYRRTGGSQTSYSSRSEAEAVPNTTKSSSSSTKKYTAPSGETVTVGTETIGGKDYAVIVGSPSAIESATKRSGSSSTQKYTTSSGRTVTVGTETIRGQDYMITVGSPEAINEVYKKPSSSSSSGGFGVYDVRNQQTRMASVIEEAAVRQQLANTAVSSAVGSSSGFTDARTLINGKNVDAVYFVPDERGSRPVAVLNRPEPISSITGTFEAAPKRSYLSYKTGEFKDKFRQGFGLMPDPYGRDVETYNKVETAGYLAGTSLAIVSSSAMAYEWLGAKIGATAYNSPKVWNLVEKGGRALESPAGQLAQRGLLVSYATFESAKLADAYFTGGPTAFAREGLTGPVRDVAFFGGSISGFKQGAKQAASETFYLVKGDSKIGTSVRGSNFESAATSRGEIYEFSGKGNVRRSFYFEDIGSASGSQTVLKQPSFSEVQTSFGVRQGVTNTNLVNANVNNYVKLQSLQSGKINYLRSFADVDVIQVSKSVKLETVNINGVRVDYGRGASKFNYLEGREVRFDSGFDVRNAFGTGKNFYSYADYPSLQRTRFTGRVASVDNRITSQFGFEETVIKRSVPEVYDLGGSSSARAKTISSQTSKSVVSLISPKLESGSSRPVSSFVRGSTSQKADVKVEAAPASARDFSSLNVLSNSAAVVSDNVVIPAAPVSRSEFLLKQSDVISQRSGLISSQSSKRSQGFEPVLDVGLRGDVISRPVSSQDSVFVTKQILKSGQSFRQEGLLETRQVLSTPSGFKAFGGFSSFVSPPTPVLPAFNLPVLPEFKDSKGPKVKTRQADFSSGYAPSIEANVFNIEGVKPSKIEEESGLFLRPIIKKSKRRRA